MIKWTESDLETIARLYEDGMPVSEIGERFSASKNAIRHQLLNLEKRGRIVRDKEKKQWTPELDAQLEALVMEGHRYAVISARIGMSKNACIGRMSRIRIMKKNGHKPVAKVNPVTKVVKTEWLDRPIYKVHPMWSMPEDERRIAFYEKFQDGWKGVQERLNAGK